MNWKRVARACMCLLVVCCVLLNICAVPAKATGLGAVIPAVTASVPGVNVIVAVLIGLGVCVGVASVDWDGLVSDIDLYLKNAGFYDAAGNVVAYFADSLTGAFSVSMELVDAVRNYLFDNDVLYEDQSYTYESTGFFIDSGSDLYVSYWEGIDLYSLVNNAVSGSILLTGANAPEIDSVSSWIGLSRQNNTKFGVDLLTASRLSDLGLYDSSSYPMGQFVDYGLGSLSNNYFMYGGVTHLCLNQADAQQIYDSGISVYRSYIYFLTPSSRAVPYLKSSPSSVWYTYTFYDIGCLDTRTGEISFLDSYIGTGEPSLSAPSSSYESYGLYPPAHLEDVITTDSDLSLGQVAPPSLSLDLGYSQWFDNSNTVVDSNTGDEIIVLPLPDVDANSDLSEVTQEEVWAGQLSDAIVDANAGTVAGTPIGDFWAGLTDAIVNPLLEGIASIFVPSQDFLSAKVDAIRSEFSFADSIISTVDFFGKGLQGVETKPPVIYIDLGASTGDYNMGGRVVFMDLSWYEEFKPLGDALISAFLWAVFAWRVFMKLPGLVSGMPGDFVMDSLQGVGADRMLPFRKKEHETVRRLNRRV